MQNLGISVRAAALCLAVACPAMPAQAQAPSIPIPPPVAKPAALVADGLPPIPAEIRQRSLPYMEFRQASFVAWSPGSRAMIVATRFGNTNQLHRLGGPGMARTQLTFEDEPVSQARIAPETGDVLLLVKDVGGNEFNQFYRWQRGQLTLLTDGKSRNTGPQFTRDGKRVIYNSTRRNGRDTDFWIMDPREPASNRMLAQVEGGGLIVGQGASALPAKLLAHLVLLKLIALGVVVGGVKMEAQGLAAAPLWWALVMAANLGGNSTPIGSVSSVIALNGLEKERQIKVGWGEFLKVGGGIVALQGALVLAYLYAFAKLDLFPGAAAAAGGGG